MGSFLKGTLAGVAPVLLLWGVAPLYASAHVDGANAASVYLGLLVAAGLHKKMPAAGVAGIWAGFVSTLILLTAVRGCLDPTGILLCAIIPASGVMTGLVIHKMAGRLVVKNRRVLSVGLFLFLAIGGFFVVFYRTPGVSYLNPVWGWWPGPVYEGVTIPGWREIAFFVSQIVAGVGFFPLIQRSPVIRSQYGMAGLFFGFQAIMLLAFHPDNNQFEAGFDRKTTEKNITVFSTQRVSQKEAELAALYAFRESADLLETLKIEKVPSIHIYLYADAWEKKEFTGAFRTSYVPVWLKKPQLHISRDDFSGTVRHELVHAILKPYGNNLFGASWNGVLIEGIAVALSPDISRRFTIDQLVKHGGEDPARIAGILHPLGFYTSRGGLSYTMAGSFVRFLMEKKGVETIKEVYASGNLQRVFGDLDVLITGWKQYLETVPVDSSAMDPAKKLFSAPSVFENPCSRSLTQELKVLDQLNNLNTRRLPVNPAHFTGNDAVFTNERIYLTYAEGCLKSGFTPEPFPDSTRFLPALVNVDRAFLYGDSAAGYSLLQKAVETLRGKPDSSAWYKALSWRYSKHLRDALLTARYRPDSLTTDQFKLLPEPALERWLDSRTLEEKYIFFGKFLEEPYVFTDKSANHQLFLITEFLTARRLELVKRYLLLVSEPLNPREIERKKMIEQLVKSVN